jgi:propionyl-CoA carboxylase beta chain
MYITGPDVVRAVTHEDVSHEDLGGAQVHFSKTGVAHFMGESDEDCLQEVRRLVSFLPSNNTEDPPYAEPADSPNRLCEELASVVPDDSNKPYDVHKVIEPILDDNDFIEVHAGFARSICVGFGRMDGRVVGIVANNPGQMAGVLDVDSSRKGARFVRFCDAFNIPIVTLVDVPGYMPGTVQELGGIIVHGAKLLYAYAEATVPRVTIILRKDYGGAYLVMGSKHLRADINLAWPAAEIAVTGPDAAANIIFRREIEGASDPESRRKELIEDYKERFANPYVAASRGFIDDVIDPRETRIKIIRALEMLENKTDTNPPKKHGNIPL